MRLTLINGYPYPYPAEASEAEQDEINDAAHGRQLTIEGVKHFEWLHTVTVEFLSHSSYECMRAAGWTPWSCGVLEAPTSSADGYGHPAIIVGGTAYCGFILENDP